MWLTRLDIRGNQMDVDGIALDNNTVADFMDNLEELPELNEQQIPMYEKVRLNRLQQEEIRNLAMKRFEISAIKTVPPEGAPTEKNKR